MFSIYHNLQQDMNNLFGDFLDTPTTWPRECAYWTQPEGELDRLRDSMLGLFDSYSSRATPSDPSYCRRSSRRDSAGKQQRDVKPVSSAPGKQSTAIPITESTPVSTPATVQRTVEWWMPRCDVEETSTEVVLHCELPGVAKEDVRLEADPQRCLVTLSGTRAERRPKSSSVPAAAPAPAPITAPAEPTPAPAPASGEGETPVSAPAAPTSPATATPVPAAAPTDSIPAASGAQAEERTFHLMETRRGNFRRTFRLPVACRPRLAEIHAHSADGILEVHCPKTDAPKSITIEIQ
ncbi:hypothetical protein PAPYR_4162 [Paratrimastix pyriformis]|uniref:SHSP domain-containing protein n=1 Tax=Paratrimastix pyriformis TaxID=342808 RepID=A0ABQ8UQZ0_9EUKA|nr:hypothetical protein PAPYR_4162 [Paratrimastix pyriformis]